MALLGTYDFQSISDEEVEVTFTYPDNCNCATVYDSSKNLNTITIQLNSGQTQPSSNFIPETYTYEISANQLNVNFEQKLTGSSVTRPKVSVEI